MICVFLTKLRKFFLSNDKNIIVSCCYRPPNGDSENLSTFLRKNIIKKSVSEKTISYIIGDFNMNCLNYHENAKTKYFYDKIFEKGTIPILNRPTRISEHSEHFRTFQKNSY